jgi:hypothetical protein
LVALSVVFVSSFWVALLTLIYCCGHTSFCSKFQSAKNYRKYGVHRLAHAIGAQRSYNQKILCQAQYQLDYVEIGFSICHDLLNLWLSPGVIGIKELLSFNSAFFLNDLESHSSESLSLKAVTNRLFTPQAGLELSCLVLGALLLLSS